jgi:hypothetical protein
LANGLGVDRKYAISVDDNLMECLSYLFFGAGPVEPLAPIVDFKVAKHARANKTGKSERPNVREVRRSRFSILTGIPHLYETLFDISSHAAAQPQPHNQPASPYTVGP